MDASDTKAYAKIVENAMEAIETVRELRTTGYTDDQLFVLAYGEKKTELTTEAAGVRPVFSGIAEEEAADLHIFHSDAEELRKRIADLGFSEAEATYYEEQLELGKVLVVAWTRAL